LGELRDDGYNKKGDGNYSDIVCDVYNDKDPGPSRFQLYKKDGGF